jgi:hypothetical protein
MLVVWMRVHRTRPPAHRDWVLLGVLVLGLVIAPLAGVGGVRTAESSGTSASLRPIAQNFFGPRVAVLFAYSTSVAEGAEARFSLNISGAHCAQGTPVNQSITRIVFHFGDGFTFQEPGAVDQLSCTSAPWFEIIPFSYWYHAAGIDQAVVNVTWGDGFSATSNVIAMEIVAPADQISPIAVAWLIGTSAVGLLVAAATVWGRRRLKKPPTLAASEV